MSDIFLSYAREDLERIEPLIQALESHGWTVWWDMALLPGDQFTTVIDRELAAARCVVVVWSTASVHSRWVRAEATEGADRGILIPVLIGEVRPPFRVPTISNRPLYGVARRRAPARVRERPGAH